MTEADARAILGLIKSLGPKGEPWALGVGAGHV